MTAAEATAAIHQHIMDNPGIKVSAMAEWAKKQEIDAPRVVARKLVASGRAAFSGKRPDRTLRVI